MISGVTAVGTSGTLVSAPPRTRAHAPANVLGRGAFSSLPATSSSASSSSRFSPAIASASAVVIAGCASDPGVAANASTYDVRIDGLAAIARYICGWVYDGSSASLCPCLR